VVVRAKNRQDKISERIFISSNQKDSKIINVILESNSPQKKDEVN